jgi:hypothetical protein
MQVPWGRFHKLYLAYPRWLAFTLWTRAIVAAEGRAPSWLAATLKKRCPGFIAKEALTNEPGVLALRLHEWIHKQMFRQAKEEGWLDALIFYGVRDLRSQATWAYWEHCEEAWDRNRPRAYPAFEKWWQTARKYKLRKKASVARVASAVERYVEWQAFAYWLRPLLEAKCELPARVAAGLERRCPGFLEFNNSRALGKQEEKGGAWRRLAGWIGRHFFSEAKKQGWFGVVVRQARNDPHHVRTVEYWKRWNKSWSQNPAVGYPSFSEWRRAADTYVED